MNDIPLGEGTHEPSRLAYFGRRVARHIRWARTEGIGRLIEEDRLNPRERVGTAWRKYRWRRADGVNPGEAVPVYVVGLQRSGTNMLMRGFDIAPYTEVRNENDRVLFDRFRLRSDDVLREVVGSSRHRVVLIKPLCDTQDVARLLDLPGLAPGRAIWVVRDVDARARSEVSKFGTSNLEALRTIKAGQGHRIWQGAELPPGGQDLIRSFDLDVLSTESAAALFWYLRNSLFYSLGLDRRDDVLLSSYDAFVADPDTAMRRLCTHLDLPFSHDLIAHVERRNSHGSRSLQINPQVRELCDDLQHRLDQTLARTTQPGPPPHTATAPTETTP